MQTCIYLLHYYFPIFLNKKTQAKGVQSIIEVTDHNNKVVEDLTIDQPESESDDGKQDCSFSSAADPLLNDIMQ